MKWVLLSPQPRFQGSKWRQDLVNTLNPFKITPLAIVSLCTPQWTSSPTIPCTHPLQQWTPSLTSEVTTITQTAAVILTWHWSHKATQWIHHSHRRVRWTVYFHRLNLPLPWHGMRSPYVKRTNSLKMMKGCIWITIIRLRITAVREAVPRGKTIRWLA